MQRVKGKARQKAKQYFGRCTREQQQAGGKSTKLQLKVGEALTLDYCPKELFVIAEVEGFLEARAQK